MITPAMLAALLVQSNAEDGLTLRDLLTDLPADPASIFALVLVIGSFALVLWAGRSKRGGGKAGRIA